MNAIASPASREPGPFVPDVGSRTCGEGVLDRVAGSQVTPVLGREVVKGQQPRLVLDQILRLPGSFHPVNRHEHIEGLCRLRSCAGLPYLVKFGLGPRLLTHGQLVQRVGRLMDPAALVPGFGEDLGQR